MCGWRAGSGARARAGTLRFGSVARCEALGRHVLGGSRDRADESRRRIRDGDRAPRDARAASYIHPGGATIGRESSGRGDAPARLLPRSERRGAAAGTPRIWATQAIVFGFLPSTLREATGTRVVAAGSGCLVEKARGRRRRRSGHVDGFWSVVTENARSDKEKKTKKLESAVLLGRELRTRHGRGVGGDGDGRRLPAGLLQRRGGGRRPRLEAPRAGAGARVDDGAVPRGGPRGRPAEDPAPGVEVRRGHDVVGFARRVRRRRDRRAIRHLRGVDRRRRWLRLSRALPGGALAAPRLLRVRRRRRDVAPARLCAGARGIPRPGARGSEDQEDREEGAGGYDAEDEGGGRSGALAARGVRGGRRRDDRRARRDLRPTPRVDTRRARRDLRAHARDVARPRVAHPRVPRRRQRRSPARRRARRHRGRGARGARPDWYRRVGPRAGAIVRDPDGASPGATPRSGRGARSGGGGDGGG